MHSLCLESLFTLGSLVALCSLRSCGRAGSCSSGGFSSGGASNLEGNSAAKRTITVVVGDYREIRVSITSFG